jgi:hypothetical protein
MQVILWQVEFVQIKAATHAAAASSSSTLTSAAAAAAAAPAPGAESLRTESQALTPARVEWRRQLRQCAVLPPQAEPVAVSVVRFSSDHRKLLVGDVRGRVYQVLCFKLFIFSFVLVWFCPHFLKLAFCSGCCPTMPARRTSTG